MLLVASFDIGRFVFRVIGPFAFKWYWSLRFQVVLVAECDWSLLALWVASFFTSVGTPLHLVQLVGIERTRTLKPLQAAGGPPPQSLVVFGRV